MLLIKAIIIAFSTYTRIPVPQIKWDGKSAGLSIPLLPLVGVVLGGAFWLWVKLCGAFALSPVLFAAVATALPIIITGGIHMDGFCDTTDALASYRDKEQRLKILKDPNVGAFAVIWHTAYILVYFALLYELYTREQAAGVCFVYTLSRVFAALSVLTSPQAKKTGMLATAAEGINKGLSYAAVCLFFLLGSLGLILSAFPYGALGILLCLPLWLRYRSRAIKLFGGITGDTTGFFLQITELTLIAGILIGGLGY